MLNRIKSVLLKIVSGVLKIFYKSTYFFSFIPQYLKSSEGLRYVSRGYCATSVNTSIFRKSSVISGGGFQYICFYDRRGNVIVGKRKLSKNRWKLRVTPFNGNVMDAHNGISLGIDGEGFLHLAYGMHGSKLKYAKSLKPHSIKFSSLMPMTGEEEERVTYPEFHTMGNGNLLFFYRNGRSGNGNMAIKMYCLEKRKWTTVQSNLIDGEGERNAYWQAWVDCDDNIFLSWVWRDNADVASNHDICFACSKDGGTTWRRADGEKYDLPITVKNAETAWVVQCGSDLINQTSMSTDEKGRPYIATYWHDKGSDVPQYRMVWNDGEKWNMKIAGKRIMPFSLRGKGTKMIPMSRPLVLNQSGKILLIFRDKEYKGTVTMAISKDLEENNWELVKLTDFDVDAWEPTFDENLWKKNGRLNLFLQATHQGDGEKVAAIKCKSSPIFILQSEQPKP